MILKSKTEEKNNRETRNNIVLETERSNKVRNQDPRSTVVTFASDIESAEG